MPQNVRLLSGPGCPVCVTSQGEIDLFIELANRPGITLCTYGDMMRVTGSAGSLEKARGNGADIRVVYSPLDAVALAEREPQRQVAFAAVGFETTTPPTAIEPGMRRISECQSCKT
jgi:hydrogenase expression/formation protein HypD